MLPDPMFPGYTHFAGGGIATSERETPASHSQWTFEEDGLNQLTAATFRHPDLYLNAGRHRGISMSHKLL